MKFQAMQNQDMSSVLSPDAKPRLKWTPELHKRFVDAVNTIGGADKATPKSLMRAMGIPGLTLYHLKSHLQKYRLGKNQSTETCSESNQEDESADCKDNLGELDLFREGTSKQDQAIDPIKESLKISQALQMQMEIQRKLHEQIEVQRHLQLRVEAQGKYLHKVLRKAQETLTGYSSSSELSQLASMVNSGCLSSSLTELTEMRAVSLEDLDREVQIRGAEGCSIESSLTSSETSSLKDEKERNFLKHSNLVELPLLDQSQPLEEVSDDVANGKRRRVCEGMGPFDLNSQYQGELDLGQAPIDLNSTEIDQINEI